MILKKFIIVSVASLVFCLKNGAQNSPSLLPAPLKYPDSAITDFGYGLELEPAVLPGRNLVFTTIQLGKGLYFSKYLGNSETGQLIYKRPEKIDFFSDQFEAVKAVYTGKGKCSFFLKDNKTKEWIRYSFEEGGDLFKIYNPAKVKLDKVPLKNEFTLINIKGKTFLVFIEIKDSRSYWPHSIIPWNHPVNPDIGFGKSYDVNNQWKGNKTLYFLKYAVLLDENKMEFSAARDVMAEGKPFVLNEYLSPTRLFSADILGKGASQVLLSWDVDKLDIFDINLSRGKLSASKLELPKGIEGRAPYNYFSLPFASLEPFGKDRNGFLIGGNPGILTEYYKNGNQWGTRPVLMKGGDIHLQTLAVPNLIDWDGDGLLDIVSGDASGFLWFIKNTGSNLTPVWQPAVKMLANNNIVRHQAGFTGSIQGPNERRWGYTQPSVVDWNGDGLLDIVCNDITGSYCVYLNSGTAGTPVLSSPQPLILNNEKFVGAWRSKPAILPSIFFENGGKQGGLAPMLAINNKGELCLYHRNAERPNELKKQQQLFSVDNKLIKIVGEAGNEGRATLNICDFNGDGKWDILFGQGLHYFLSKVSPQAVPYSTLYVMINKGSNEVPVFDTPKRICSNGNNINLDVHGAWASLQLNESGRIIKAIAGGEDGRLYPFERLDLCN